MMRRWTYEFIPQSYPNASPTPKFWYLGVGEAGLKNVGEAENRVSNQSWCNFQFLNNF